MPTLLVIHGMFCTRWHARGLAEALERALQSSPATGGRGPWRVQAPNLPGREETSASAGSLGLRDYVEFVKAAAQRAKEESDDSVGLLGHSMGGLVCLLAAAELASSDWLGPLCLLGAAPPAGAKGFTWGNLKAFLPAVLRRSETVAPFRRETYFSLFMNRQDEELRQRIYPRLVPESRRVLREIALPALDRRGASRWRPAAEPRFPSLVIAGAADRSTPPRVQEWLAARLPGASYHCLEDLDHYGFLAGAGSAAVVETVVDFLKR